LQERRSRVAKEKNQIRGGRANIRGKPRGKKENQGRNKEEKNSETLAGKGRSGHIKPRLRGEAGGSKGGGKKQRKET